jgi:predicted nucleic acid-binding protein
MILVDTSMWIKLLGGTTKLTSDDDLTHFVTCGPVVQEVTQGLREGRDSDAFRSAFLALQCLSDPLPLNIFLEAAELYRYGRSRGYTIRSSIDCLIAAVAIENQVPVSHCDRDFSNIAKYTRLSIFQT